MKKKCSKCHEIKGLDEFYKHSEMADGRLNKCKECTKADTKKSYRNNREYYREYDRQRAMLPHRVEMRLKYQSTEEGQAKYREGQERWAKRNKLKRHAHSVLWAALRGGRVVRPNDCEVCLQPSTKIHGHHEDYSKPLDVVWVCIPCHAAIHRGKIVLLEAA